METLELKMSSSGHSTMPWATSGDRQLRCYRARNQQGFPDLKTRRCLKLQAVSQQQGPHLPFGHRENQFAAGGDRWPPGGHKGRRCGLGGQKSLAWVLAGSWGGAGLCLPRGPGTRVPSRQRAGGSCGTARCGLAAPGLSLASPRSSANIKTSLSVCLSAGRLRPHSNRIRNF